MIAINNSFPLEVGWTKIVKANKNYTRKDIKEFGFVEFTYPLPSSDCWLLYLNTKKLNELKCVDGLKNLFYNRFKDIKKFDGVDCAIVTKAQIEEFRNEAFKVLAEEISGKDVSALILIDLANTKAKLIEASVLAGIFCFDREDVKCVRVWAKLISAKMESLSE